MTTTPASQHEFHIHQWDKGLNLFKNKDAQALRAGCGQLFKIIKTETYPSTFKESLIDWCIWKHTTCEFVFSSFRGTYPMKRNEDELIWGDKYAARYYSENAWNVLDKTKNKSSIHGLRLDHVWERRFLRKEVLEGFNSNIIEKFVACVVIKEEHHALSKEGQGWARYEGKQIYRYCDETSRFCKCRVKDGKWIPGN